MACAYQDPDSKLSLREGLDEYRRANARPGFLDEEELTRTRGERVAALFHNHDRIHVVFGLSTELRHEVLADTWTFAGADIHWREYVDYLREPAAQELLQDIGYLETARVSIQSIPAVLRAIARARRMKKPWPFADHDAYLDIPLNEIRREFGIELVA